VRSRAEKSAAAEIAAKGYDVCSATAPQRRVWADRVRVVEMPIFPGYIFARFDPSQKADILRSAGVVSIVRLGHTDSRVDETEMHAIRSLLHSGLEILRSPYLKVGSLVRVRSGSLKDACGVLTQVKNRFRLVVAVTLLQRAVAVEIDEAMVEPLWPQAGLPPAA
jgi:transcription antitermination factor NusG